MYLIDTEWILCPVCGSKTRDRLREDRLCQQVLKLYVILFSISRPIIRIGGSLLIENSVELIAEKLENEIRLVMEI